MQYGGTVLYVDQVAAVADFYRRAFGLELRFFDEALGFAELETGGSTLAIAAHSLRKMLMPDGYMRPVNGQPAGVEIAFLTRDVSVHSPRQSRKGLRRSHHRGECHGPGSSVRTGTRRYDHRLL